MFHQAMHTSCDPLTVCMVVCTHCPEHSSRPL